MVFKIVNGRPEGTEVLDSGVIHYTCNPPNLEALSHAGIQLLGDQFSIDPREVLLIPETLFDESSLPKNTIGAETLLSRLSRK